MSCVHSILLGVAPCIGYNIISGIYSPIVTMPTPPRTAYRGAFLTRKNAWKTLGNIVEKLGNAGG
jgi:hypothetical protein